jgi:hypothetical protein
MMIKPDADPPPRAIPGRRATPAKFVASIVASIRGETP